jgi:hypothetical protein
MERSEIEQKFLDKTYEIGRQEDVCSQESKKLNELRNEANELFKEMMKNDEA